MPKGQVLAQSMCAKGDQSGFVLLYHLQVILKYHKSPLEISFSKSCSSPYCPQGRYFVLLRVDFTDTPRSGVQGVTLGTGVWDEGSWAVSPGDSRPWESPTCAFTRVPGCQTMPFFWRKALPRAVCSVKGPGSLTDPIISLQCNSVDISLLRGKICLIVFPDPQYI